MRLQTKPITTKARGGFTLVEMIGVLAIIAILASLLIPRVFQAIGDSKISNAATTCNSIKAAVNEYYGKFGLIADANGNPLDFDGANIFEDWDLNTLVAGGFAEKPFSVRIGNGQIGAPNGTRLRVIRINLNGPTTDPATDLNSGAYNLDGANQVNDIVGALLVEAVIMDVDAQDAKALNDRLDGPNLSSTDVTVPADPDAGTPEYETQVDYSGRVKYAVDATGKANVHIYIAHR